MHFSAKRGIAIACRLSVCLSLRPSICLWRCYNTGYIPGAAAPGYLLMKMMKMIVLLTSRAAVAAISLSDVFSTFQGGSWRNLCSVHQLLPEKDCSIYLCCAERSDDGFLTGGDNFVNFQLWPRVLLVIVGRLENSTVSKKQLKNPCGVTQQKCIYTFNLIW